jgi:spoIIIJ-associated protein
MPAALPQLEETMTDQTVSDEVTEVDSDADVAETEAQADTEAETEGKPASGADTLENEGEIAADYLEELLDIADLDGDIDTYVEGGRAHVSIVTDGDLLVGSDGSVLEALQELARLAVMTETGRRSRLMLDIAGHRDRRRKEIEALAKDAIGDVKESGEPVRLAPMNPFERKIVHDVVAAAGLVSESEGEEPRRCVVVRPA